MQTVLNIDTYFFTKVSYKVQVAVLALLAILGGGTFGSL